MSDSISLFPSLRPRVEKDVQAKLRVVWELTVSVLFTRHCLGVGEDDSKRPGGPRSQQQQAQNQNMHSEQAMSKEQLYDMFQQILGVKKFEHQLLFNALQVRFIHCLHSVEHDPNCI